MLQVKQTRQRKAARDKGLSIYTGQPCPHGHAHGLRYTANGACIDCVKQTSKASYDTDKASERKRAYRARLKAQAIVDIGADMLDAL